MAKRYKKAPAYMGKYLSIKIGNRDKTVQDHDVLTGNLDMYVELGMLVEDTGPAPAPAPKPAPASTPAPALASSPSPEGGITKSPAAKMAAQQLKAFSKVKSTPKAEPVVEEEAPKDEPKKKTTKGAKKGTKKKTRK